MAKLFWERWILPFGAPGRLTADNDPRWAGKEGPFTQLLQGFGVERHLTTPYRSESNGRCERHVQEFNKVMRVVRLEQPTLGVSDLVLVAVAILNGQPHSPDGLSSFELFHNGRKPTSSFLEWTDFTDSDHFAKNFGELVARVRDKMVTQRTWRREVGDRRQPSTHVGVGRYVLVHHKRFPSHPLSKFDSPWMGPFLVVQFVGREVVLQVGATKLRVALSQVKLWGGQGVPEQPQVPTMTAEEMAAQGVYLVERVLSHRKQGRG